MYKRICVLGDKNQFLPFDYKQPADSALRSMGQNSGNNVFIFALQKMTLTNKANVDFMSLQEFFACPECVNDRYDALLYSPANILAPWTKDKFAGLKHWTQALKKVKIPVCFVGVGSQSDKYYSLDFISDFKKEGYDFIKALLKHGNRVGLRGYFTAEVVKKLGFSDKDFAVVGCPSLFMNGPGLKIEKTDLKPNDLNPVFNGNHFWFDSGFHKLFGQYSKSIFVCQDLMYRLMYDASALTEVDAQYLRSDLFEWLFKSKRVRLYCDFMAWLHDMKTGGFNFSVGTRIHGNIVSLLAGIPAYIDAFDSRVKEMAEFFDIPHGDINPETLDLYELYQCANYYKFNATFKDKFDNFKRFLEDAGFPCFEDEKYINRTISKLRFSQPDYNTTNEQVHDFTREYWHLYYPESTKTPEDNK